MHIACPPSLICDHWDGGDAGDTCKQQPPCYATSRLLAGWLVMLLTVFAPHYAQALAAGACTA